MKKSCTILVMTMALFLAACGPDGKGDVSNANPDGVAGQDSRSGFDWRIDEWKTDLSTGTSHTLYLGEFAEGLEADQVGDRSTIYRTWGNNLYGLDRFAQKFLNNDAVQWLYSLDCYQGKTGEISQRSISLPSMQDYAALEKTVSTFDIMNDREIVLFVQARQDGNNKAYLAVHMSMDGKPNEDADVVDLQPVIQKNGGMLEEGTALENVYVDHRGYYYVISDTQQGRVLVLKPDGSLAEVLKADRDDMQVNFACKDPDGDPVFKWYSFGEEMLQLAGYDPETGRKVYAEAKLPWESPMAMTEDGYLFYGNIDGNLYRWDLYTGSRELCINYGIMGIGQNPYTLCLITDAEMNPILVDRAGGSAKFYHMGTDSGQQKTMIRLVSMAPNCDYMSAWAVDFSRAQDEYAIIVEKPEMPVIVGGDWSEYFDVMDSFRDRAMMELATGDAADLYFVSAADMKLLYEKGALADLTGVLPDELTECIFPGVLAGGMFDGKQVGLAVEAYATVTMVSNDIWPGNSWTLEEALELIEADPHLEFLVIQRSSKSNAPQMLMETFLQDMNHSPFLDLEKKTCDFTNPLFIRLLALTKDYGPYQSWESDPLQDGIAAGFSENIDGFSDFSSIMNEYGDNYHPVGLPTDGVSGNYWSSDYYLVMAKDTPYEDILEDYLMQLFDIERQRSIMRPVRNDLISQCIVYNDFDPYTSSEWLWDRGNGEYYWVPMKPDGSSWEREYLELMNSCVAKPGDTEFIFDILWEELGSYYDGSKDAVTVAEIIQNRVQLYLDERN